MFKKVGDEMEKKYLFFDVDGTLRTHDEKETVPASTIRTIKKLIENGHFVALATGRAYWNLGSIREYLGITSVVAEGGHLVVVDDEVIFEKPLDNDLVKRIVTEAKVANIPYALCDLKGNYTEYEKMFEFIGGLNLKLVDSIDLADYEKIFKVYLDLQEHNAHLIPSLREYFVLYFRNFAIVEADEKYYGIKKVLEHFRADEEDVIVFGDGMNDIKMFTHAKTSVAMGNAVQPLKDIATFVTKDIEEDGIEYACQQLGLI